MVAAGRRGPGRRRGADGADRDRTVSTVAPFTVHLFGHTTVSTPDRTLRASDFTGVKPRQILELVALGRG